MKKMKAQKPGVPVSLSAKKSGALKHEMLFTPYKIEWKNVPSQAVSQTSSRTFFTSMKSQLSSLKNDVQKLIKKQNSKTENKSLRAIILDDNIHNKSQISQKTQGSANKLQNSRQLQPDVETGKFQERMLNEVNFECTNNINIQQQNTYNKADFDRLAKQLADRHIQIDNLLKENRLQKNLISQLKKQNHQLYTQTQNKQQIMANLRTIEKQDQNKHKQIQTLLYKNAEIQSKLLNYQHNYEKLKQKNQQLVQKIQAVKQASQIQNIQTKRINQQLKSHNVYLQQKIENLSEKMNLVSGKFKQKQFYIRQMQAKLQALRISKKQYQMNEQTDKIKVNEECKKQIQQRQKEIIQKYQRQFEKLQKNCKQKMQQSQITHQRQLQKIRQQNLALIYKCNQLQEHLQIQQNNKSIKSQIVDFKHLGTQFEKKINELVQENYGLKNKIVSLQSDIQRLQVQKGVLNDEIRIYQQIKQQNKNNESNETRWERAIDEIQSLKREKQNLIEEYEFKLMKLQNQLQNKKQTGSKSIQIFDYNNNITNFNKVFKDQLHQNQCIKQKLKEQTSKVCQIQQTLKQQQQKYTIVLQELAVCKLKSDLLEKNQNKQQTTSSSIENQEIINKLKYEIDLVKRKYEGLNSMLDAKNKQIKAKDQFIQKVLISKANKKEEQDEIAYVLNEVKLFSQVMGN